MTDIITKLPSRIAEAVSAAAAGCTISEIRIREGRPVSVTVGRRNILCDCICSASDLGELLLVLCGGSVHAYGESIRNGFISAGDGCRVGVCGRAVTENGKVTGISDITSLNIRIPCTLRHISGELCEYLRRGGYCGGVLLYSLPGIGKTTLLRDAAATLAAPPYMKRVALIDTREELYVPELFEGTMTDVFSGYPKAQGIEIATRTMSPELIFCDEIGGIEEAETIVAVQNAGVPLIASAHASGIASMLRRPGLRLLHENRVFECYMGVRRSGGGFELTIDHVDSLP